jgi:hypothetical protein
VVPEGVDDASNTPAVPFAYRRNDGAGRADVCKDSVRIGDGQNHPDGTPAERLRAEVAVFWRFIANPLRNSLLRVADSVK